MKDHAPIIKKRVSVLVMLFLVGLLGFSWKGCRDQESIDTANSLSNSNAIVVKIFESQLDQANQKNISDKVDANEKLRAKDAEISKLSNENNSFRQSISTYEAAHVIQISSNFDNSLTNALSNALSEINSSKPSFQLFFHGFKETQTGRRFETNFTAINEIIEMSKSPSLEGLSPGSIIDLKGLKYISLSVLVSGESSAEHLTIQLMTPWAEPNITGSYGWQELGSCNFLNPEDHTFTTAHGMMCELTRLIPAHEFARLPNLIIPTNYVGLSVPIQFKIYSNNSKPQEVGVVFKF